MVPIYCFSSWYLFLIPDIFFLFFLMGGAYAYIQEVLGTRKLVRGCLEYMVMIFFRKILPREINGELRSQ